MKEIIDEYGGGLLMFVTIMAMCGIFGAVLEKICV